MTANGLKRLQEELHHLKTVERHEIIKAIADAREHGDLSENAEYSAAKEKQAFIEGRIADVEAKISLAEVIDIKKLATTDTVIFGVSVTILDLDNDNKITYQIVGDDEADLKKLKISVNSPVAKSLIGKTIGQVIEVTVPSGTREYEIIDIII